MIGGFVLALYALVSIDRQYGSALSGGPGAFASAVHNYNAKLVYGLTGTSVEVTEPSYTVGWMKGRATAATLFFTWWFSILWSGAYLLTIGWALMFWILLDRFVDLIVTDPASNILRNMRNFNKIVVLIEKYDEAFGAITFLGVVSGAIHYSFLGYQVFKTWGTNIYLQQTTATVIFLWFAGFMSTCASVHRKVTKIRFSRKF